MLKSKLVMVTMLLAVLVLATAPTFISRNAQGEEREVNIPPYLVDKLEMLSGMPASFLKSSLEEKDKLGDLHQGGRLSPVIPPWSSNIIIPPPPSLTLPQSEPSICANPLNPNQLVAIFHNIIVDGTGTPIPPFYGISAMRSLDGGVTWDGPFYLPIPNGYDVIYDPVTRWSSDGRVYASYIGLNATTSDTALMIAYSDDSGATWSDLPIIANQETGDVGFLDKDWFDVSGNALAVSCTNFLNTGAVQIEVVISTDRGTSWTSPIILAGPSTTNTLHGTHVEWGDSPGEIYVAWYDDKGTWLSGDFAIWIRRSTDYGGTWEAPVLAATVPNELPYVFYAKPGTYLPGDIRAWPSMFPHVAVDQEGNVYIVSTTNPDLQGAGWPNDQGDIVFIRSTDQGATWEPIKIFSIDNDQFFPAIGVQSDGTVHITFGDRQYDTTTPNDDYDISYISSTDRGVTFTSPQLITDASSDPVVNTYFAPGASVAVLVFAGDYFDVAVTDNAVHPIWGDRRGAKESTDYDIATVRGEKLTPVGGVIQPTSIGILLPLAILISTTGTILFTLKKIRKIK